MSFTNHYDENEASIEKCLEILKDKNPKFEEGKNGYFGLLSWDEKPRDGHSRYGVFVSKIKATQSQHSNVISFNKGCVTVWNGQGYLSDYLEENGISMLWWD